MFDKYKQLHIPIFIGASNLVYFKVKEEEMGSVGNLMAFLESTFV